MGLHMVCSLLFAAIFSTSCVNLASSCDGQTTCRPWSRAGAGMAHALPQCLTLEGFGSYSCMSCHANDTSEIHVLGIQASEPTFLGLGDNICRNPNTAKKDIHLVLFNLYTTHWHISPKNGVNISSVHLIEFQFRDVNTGSTIQLLDYEAPYVVTIRQHPAPQHEQAILMQDDLFRLYMRPTYNFITSYAEEAYASCWQLTVGVSDNCLASSPSLPSDSCGSKSSHPQEGSPPIVPRAGEEHTPPSAVPTPTVKEEKRISESTTLATTTVLIVGIVCATVIVLGIVACVVCIWKHKYVLSGHSSSAPMLYMPDTTTVVSATTTSSIPPYAIGPKNQYSSQPRNSAPTPS